eukprot:2357255-Rhodomonas_salina.1
MCWHADRRPASTASYKAPLPYKTALYVSERWYKTALCGGKTRQMCQNDETGCLVCALEHWPLKWERQRERSSIRRRMRNKSGRVLLGSETPDAERKQRCMRRCFEPERLAARFGFRQNAEMLQDRQRCIFPFCDAPFLSGVSARLT